MADKPPETPHNFPSHVENFEVVLIKEGVSELNAKEEDFQRVPVSAATPLAAEMHDDVKKVKGFRPLFAAKPGVPTDPEIHARRRAMEGPRVDPTKV